MRPIVLASQSPRRKQLLEWAEIDFKVLVKETDESFPSTLTPQEAAIYVARNKAMAVRSSGMLDRYEQRLLLLAADTMVVQEGRIIGKPSSRQEAIEILQALSGRRHEVVTGVVVLDGEAEHAFADTTEVWFHDLSNEQIIHYVDRYQPFDKAGGYGIQDWIGVVGIKMVKGDFYNVMGLPVSRVVRLLEQL